MLEFTKSTLSFTWAMSLLGAKQVVDLVSNPTGAPKKANTAFDATTAAAGEQMDDLFRSLFLAGDSLQREVSDGLARLFTPDVFNPRSSVNAEMLRRLAEIGRSLNPGQDGMLTWRELRNKVEVFQTVYRVPSMLDLPSESPYPPLTEFVEKAYDLEEYPALWAVEGLGHYHGDTYYRRDETPRGILDEKTAGVLPAKSLTMLHAGVGMSIAQHKMKRVNHLSPIADVRSVLAEIIASCRENSRPGYEGATIESLGLITRNGQFYGEMRPEEMVGIVGNELASMDAMASDYYWHGVGRATYFLPIHFVPGYGSVGHAVQMVRDEVMDETARQNAISGLAWAVTMVNIRHPEILAVLLKSIGDVESDCEAFSNGVMSSIIMRTDTTPGAPFIEALYHHEPQDEELREKWAEHVSRPCERALETYSPALRKHHRLGEIFRCQSLARLVDDLEAPA